MESPTPPPLAPRPGTQELADALVVVRCQLGERQAFDDLIQRWARPLRGHVARVLGHAEAADDVVQDIWVAVLLGIGRLKDPGKLRPWLFGIAHRKLMDRLRDRRASAQAPAEQLEQLPGDGPPPEHGVEAGELEQALARLPPAEREVLGLFHFDGLSLAEIAESLALPLGTVKSRLFRARQLLRHQLTGERHD